MVPKELADCSLGLRRVCLNTQHTAAVHSFHAGSGVGTAFCTSGCHTAANIPCNVQHISQAYACSNTGKGLMFPPFWGTEPFPQHTRMLHLISISLEYKILAA